MQPASQHPAPKPTGSREKFHAYPWWSPRFWHGMPLAIWLDLLREHRARASFTKWGLVGTVTLADGTSVKGFVAEPRAMTVAEDITHLGGWRAYIAQKN